jgi:hypothetical protein
MGEEESDSTITSLTKAYNDYNSMQIRLNTEPLLERYELFIRGERVEYIADEAGNIRQVRIKVSAPKANPQGINEILQWISGILNPQVVQGNFMVDKRGYSRAYEDYIFFFRNDFMDYLLTNIYDYEIDEKVIMGLVDQAELVVRPFMTRLINNEERRGFGREIKSDSTSVLRQKSGFGGLFGKT